MLEELVSNYQEIWCMHRILGVEVNIATKHYSVKKYVRELSTNDNAECKSRHSSMHFHKMRKSVAAGIIAPCHACSEENIADVLTKSFGIETHNNLKNRVPK